MQGKNLPAIVLCGVAALFILVGLFSTSWANRSRGSRTQSIGTSEEKRCRGGECRTRKFDPDRMRNRQKPVYLGGKAVFAWGMINVLLFIAAGVLLFLGHSASHIPPRISLFTAIFSLLLGALFVVIIMATTRGKPIATPGFAFYIHNLGCIAGIVGSAMAWKKVAAIPGAMGQPMPGQPMPGQPMPGQAMPGQAMPGQPMPGQPMPGQPMPGQHMQGQDPAMQAQDPAMQAQAPAQAQAQAPCPTCGGAARWVPEHSRYYCDACAQYV